MNSNVIIKKYNQTYIDWVSYMENFRKEAKEIPTTDLLLILEDQLDLYSDEEIEILREELDSRPINVSDLEDGGNKRKSYTEVDEEQLKKQVEADEAQREAAAQAQRLAQEEAKRRESLRQTERVNKINSLRQRGYNGYYEYLAVSLLDDDGGSLTPAQITRLLNAYAMDGWKLVSAYSNELGHKSTSGGIAGFSAGVNSTIDQHILILERFVRI